MIEYLIAIGSILVFLTHYIFTLGRLDGRVASVESEVKWIRDYIISRNLNSNMFKQESSIRIEENLEWRALSPKWKGILKTTNVNYSNCITPFDYGVRFSEYYGIIAMQSKAKSRNVSLETLLLASGIYLCRLKNGSD